MREIVRNPINDAPWNPLTTNWRSDWIRDNLKYWNLFMHNSFHYLFHDFIIYEVFEYNYLFLSISIQFIHFF